MTVDDSGRSNEPTAPKPRYPRVRVSLAGKYGNTDAIIGACSFAAWAAGVPRAAMEAFREEAMAGDYKHLLRTCARYFDVR